MAQDTTCPVRMRHVLTASIPAADTNKKWGEESERDGEKERDLSYCGYRHRVFFLSQTLYFSDKRKGCGNNECFYVWLNKSAVCAARGLVRGDAPQLQGQAWANRQNNGLLWAELSLFLLSFLLQLFPLNLSYAVPVFPRSAPHIPISLARFLFIDFLD